MKLAIIGFGQAGGKILDRLLAYDSATGTGMIGHAVAVNTAETDLLSLEAVPKPNRVLIGETVVNGHGTGTEPELGQQCAGKDIKEIHTAVKDAPISDIDAFLVIAGFGGGTGSGGGPVLAEYLREKYVKPVYGLGILPSDGEGGIYHRNAADALEQFVGCVDNLMLFDNDAFETGGESFAEGYEEVNAEIVRRFGTLFSAGNLEALDGSAAEAVVDASEVINTLGEQGITSLGFASESVVSEKPGLLDRFKGGDDEIVSASGDAKRVVSLVQRATMGQLTVPCGVESTKRALVVISGPPDQLDRKGIQEARRWLEQHVRCREIRAGDYPVPGGDEVSALVVLSGVTDVPRIEDVQQQAIEANEDMFNNNRNDAADELQSLVEYGPDGVESVESDDD